MRSIAFNGKGNYYFIDDEKKILAHTHKEMFGFMSVIGTNCNLKVRGKNEVIVNKFLTTEKVDVKEGYNFGDLTSNDTKQFLVEIECSPKKEESVVGIIYKLSYLVGDEKIVKKGEFVMDFTDDDSKIKDINNKVKIALLVDKSDYINETVKELTKKNEKVKAIDILQKYIEELKEYEDLDDTKFISNTINDLKNPLEELKKKDFKRENVIKYSDRNQYNNVKKSKNTWQNCDDFDYM
jgi:hypothetical protein